MEKQISTHDLFAVYREVLEAGQSVCCPVSGTSMVPWLRHGKDRVLLVRRDTYRTGDIVLLQTVSGRYLLHRIVRVQDGMVLTWGDGNLRSDGWTPADRILGVATQIERSGTWHSAESPGAKLLFWLWVRLRVFRRPALACIGRIARWKSKL